MRLLSAVSLALCASQTIAHADVDGRHAVPKLAGARKFLKEFKGERRWGKDARSAPTSQPREHRQDSGLEERGGIEERQNTNGRCGSRYGSCATGYCCSYEGYCGRGEEYCTSPDCQLNYGTGCDGNQKPSGVDTSTIARPKLGKVAYGGVGIYDCVNDGDIAITFDDGPWNYTDALLDKLAKYEAKATFFITGTNLYKGQINDPSTPWPSIIQRMAAEGHQIASHTWSHENYSQLTTAQFQNQIYWNEIALNDILGYFPTYMRPPYSICPTNTCGSQLANLGYHVVYFDLDTEGYLHDDPSEIQVSKDIWDDTVPGTNPCRNSFLQIEHDIHYEVVYTLADYILESLFESGYRSVTVGQCLGDPPENWYRAGSKPVPSYSFTPRVPTGTWSCLTQSATSTGPTPTSTLKVSTDGDCGPGITCQGSRFGNCCSVNGFCGASIDYCGSNCNPQFGGCSVGDDPLPSDLPLPSGPDDPIPSSTTSGPAPTNTLQVSIDGNCGDGFTCDGSEFGNCCSQYGFCGSNDDYCLEGCQPIFGSGCKGSGSTTTTTTTPTPTTTTTTTPTPTTTTRSSSSSSTRTTTTKTTTTKTTTTKTTTTKTTTTTKSTTTKTTTTRTTTTSPTPTVKPVTKDGRCGPQYGTTCTGSLFGSCCNGLTNRCGILCLIGNCIPGYGSCPLGKETTGEQIAAS